MMKTRKTTRLIGLFLSVLMLVTLFGAFSLTAGAADAADAVSYVERAWDDTNQKVTFTDKSVTDYTTVASATTATAWGSTGTTTWYVVKESVEISSRITVTGDVHLVLVDGATLTASKGIKVDAGNALSIYGQSDGDDAGKLIATGTDAYCAGIGGKGTDASLAITITIHGGNITASSAGNGAGIGGASIDVSDYNQSDVAITIHGGTVNATGASGFPGIGGSCGNSSSTGAGGTITINGGTVNATGGVCGAGIGGGSQGNPCTITINGGTVTAGTAIDSNSGAGIGGGYQVDGGNITINGGTIIAKACYDAAAIGGGYCAGAGTIVINGGNITANVTEQTYTYGAAIGSGGGHSSSEWGEGGGTVTINGGNINAIGGNSGGTGIGSGAYCTSPVSVTITGGTIVAQGGTSAYAGAGIGSGYSTNGGNVVISGGNVKAISGGSSAESIGKSNSGASAGTLTDGNGNNVSLVTVTLPDVETTTGVIALGGITYGLNDVSTTDTNKLYLYMTEAQVASVESVTMSDSTVYLGSVIGNTGVFDNGYSVFFAANGGSGTMDSVVVTEESQFQYVLPACGFTASDGKVFSGWSVVIGTADAVLKQPGDTITLNDNATVTAIWEDKYYFVTPPTAISGLTYNGEARTLTIAGVASEGTVKYRLSETEAWSETIPTATNAGTYTVYYAILVDETEYYAKGSVEVTVARKAITPTIHGLDEIYGPLLDSEFPFCPSIDLMDGDEEIPDADYDVSYTNNKAVGTATLTVTANDDGNYSFDTLTENYIITDHEHVWEYSVDGTNEYIGYATCTGDGTCDVGGKVTFVLTASSNLIYDGTPKAATLTVDRDFDTANLFIVYSHEDGSYANMSTPTAVGSYMAKVTLADGVTIQLEYTISPRDLTLEWSNTELTYNGEPQLPTAEIAGGVIDGDTVSVTVELNGDGSAIYVDTHSALASIDNDNYTLTNETQEFTIVALELESPVIDAVEYDGTKQTAVVPENDSYTVITNDGGTGAGTYNVVLQLTDSKNTKWKDSNTNTLTLKFVIQKRSLDEKLESEYTGEAQSPSIPADAPYKLLTTDTFMNVGEYAVVLQLIDTVNYEWKNPNAEDATLTTATFTVTKADNEWVTDPSIEDWKMTEEANAPVYEAKFGNENVQVTYYPADGNVEDATETVPTTAGVYVARFTVAGTDHYGELVTEVTFGITPPPVSIGGWVLPKLHYMDTLGNITATQPTGGYAYLRADGVLVLNNFVIDATIFNTIEVTEENEHLYVYPFSTENSEASVIMLNGDTTVQLIGQNRLKCVYAMAITAFGMEYRVTLRGGMLETDSAIYAGELVIENCGITVVYIVARDALTVSSSVLYVYQGLIAGEGTMTLTDSTVETYGDIVARQGGIEVNDCTVKAGYLWAEAGEFIAENSTFVFDNDFAFAIKARTISMTSCEITATSGECVFWGYSILTDCKITATNVNSVFEGSSFLTDCTVEMTGCEQFIFSPMDVELNNCEIKSTNEYINTEDGNYGFIHAYELVINGGSLSIENTNVGLNVGGLVAKNAEIEIGFLGAGIYLLNGGSFEGCTVTLNGNPADLPSGSSNYGILCDGVDYLAFVESSLTVTATNGIEGSYIYLYDSDATVTATVLGVYAETLVLDGASTLNVTIVGMPEEDSSTETTETVLMAIGVKASELVVYDDRSVISIKLNEGVTGKALIEQNFYAYYDNMQISAPEGAEMQAIPQAEGETAVWYEVVLIDGETVTYPTAVTISYVEDEEESEPTEAKVVVGGVKLADGEYLDNNGTVSTEKPAGGYAYLSDGVLTLHDFTYIGVGYLYDTEYNESKDITYKYYAGIYSATSLTLRVEGKNLLDLTTFAGDYYTYGIFVDADLKLEGDGVLEFSCTDDGIEVWGDLTGSDCTVQMTTGGEGFDVYGDVVLENCELTLDVVDDGIWASEEVVLVDCTVEITSLENDGIYSSGDIWLYDCTLNINADTDGIDTGEDLNATGCELVIVAQDHGIEGDYNITLTDCVLNITAGDAGIYTEGDVILTNCTGTVTADEEGIDVDGSLTLKGCELTLTTGSDAITTYGEILIENSTLTMNSSCCGIYLNGEDFSELTVLDSTLTINAIYYGFYVYGEITVSGSELNISAGDEAISAPAVSLTDCTGSIYSSWYEAIDASEVYIENCTMKLESDYEEVIFGTNMIQIIGGKLELYGYLSLETSENENSYIYISNAMLYLESWGDATAIYTYGLVIEGDDTCIGVQQSGTRFVDANTVKIDEDLNFFDTYGSEAYLEDGTVYNELDNALSLFILISPENDLISGDDTVVTAPTLTVGDKVLENGQYLGNNGEVTDEMPAGGFAYYYDGTLILKDFVLETEGTALTTVNGEAIVAGIYCDSNLTIRLMGESSIKLTSEGSVGIAVGDGDLTLTGDGSLALDCAGTGIEVIGDLTVDGTALTVKAVGIAVQATNARIQDATVTVETLGDEFVCSIQVNRLDVIESKLTVNAGGTLVDTDTDFEACAIYCMIGKVSFLDSSVTLTSNYGGIIADKIDVTNCDLTIDAVDGGLLGWSAIILSDSTVTVTANGENASGLLVVNGMLTVADSTVEVTANGENADGLCVINGTLTVSDSTLTVSTSNVAIQATSIQIAEALAILIPADGKIAVYDDSYSILDSTDLVAAQVTIGADPKVTVEADTVTIGGVKISDGEYLDNNGNITAEKPEGGYAYLKDGVLTLNNFVYQTKKYDSYEGISCKTDLTLVLIGENLINSYDQYAIRVDGDLTVSGDGTLTVVTSVNGIYVENTLTVDCGGLTVTAGNVAVEADDVVFLGNEIKLTVTKGKNAVIANKSITLGELMAVSSPEGAIVQKIDGKYVLTDANGNAVTELTVTWAAHDCIDEDLFDHLCDICGKATLTCKDTDLDHACDACGGEMGYHADTNGDHACEYGCQVSIGSCEDNDTDHKCDYGCAKVFGECKDADTDHDCDYGCDKVFGNCADADRDHDCDYGCNKTFGTCADADTDHDCDYGCAKVFGECKDADTDHDCDYGCDKVFGNCADGDRDHDCDYGCDKTFGTCADADTDHDCDYGCAKVFGECKDADTDHDCDYGCDKVFGNCADADRDHDCDYGCDKTFGTCADADTDHDCDYGCVKVFGEHTAVSGSHICNYCKDEASDCADANSDHICDVCGDELKHSYSATWKSDKNLHWHECSCGVKKDVTVHTPGSAATETQPQVCTVCEHVVTPATGHVNHTAKTAWLSDATHHWHECTGCNEQMEKSVHRYDNACDTSCNDCGAVRSITHSYGTAFKHDASKHWYECTVCEHKKEEVDHTPGAEATETAAQTCTVCGFVMTPAIGHNTHTAKTDWVSDSTHHWHDCTGCNEQMDKAEHAYDNDCDTTCNGCGKIRTVTHDYKSAQSSDATGHWTECAECGNKIQQAEHTFGEWTVKKAATATEKGSKTKSCACGFTVEEAIPALGDGEQTTEPTPSDNDGGKGLGTGAIVAIVIGSTAVAGVGGFAIWWFVINKRTLVQLGDGCKGVAMRVGGACKGAAQKVKGFFTKK